MKGIISDMDGVIYRGNKLIPEAKSFIDYLQKAQIPFLFLTNNSEQTALDLKLKLQNLGIQGITEANFITSAMATSIFLKSQKPNAKVFVVGKGGLINELYNAGFSLTEHNPDYVVVGKTNDFNFTMLKKAVNLINQGAKFIGTNPDVIDPIENGIEP
ncbi:MAG: TIGR01457 family HAD-type hydrolase, partial [Candidatus Margulisiibacteriota bacterium]